MKFCLFLLCLLSIPGFSQTEDTAYADIEKFVNTGKQIFSAPGSFDRKDIINLSGVLLASAGAFYADNEVKDFALRNKNNFNKHLFNIDTYFYVPFSIALTAGTYSYGYFAEDPEIRQLGLNLGEAAFYSSITNILIKYFSGRSRPLRTDDNLKFNPFGKQPRYSAFGSAHTTLAFAISTVMADYSDNILWKSVWFSAAGLVGASRIYHNMHWFSDVVLGGSIGYFIGKFVLDEDREPGLIVTPAGLSLIIQL